MNFHSFFNAIGALTLELNARAPKPSTILTKAESLAEFERSHDGDVLNIDTSSINLDNDIIVLSESPKNIEGETLDTVMWPQCRCKSTDLCRMQLQSSDHSGRD